ncbi:YfcZ/YiiS family protein [Shewanella sp. AS1]|uniref:DUF406 family protein n=1 Tax=Shewanella sp. AS1 TaxID=2907626 RepID=UPI001F3BEE5C|nr:DUF406 family protein [Shewanella sp. AS1]MCE9678541.1 YfcZ/YiiS family protein [Shewanella sp. AS1]
MNNIEKAQSDLINDTCNDCGSYADIGAVIDEHDTLLTIERVGSDSQQAIAEFAKAAQAKFDGVKVEVVDIEGGQRLMLTFAFSAEKMIFQLQQGL